MKLRIESDGTGQGTNLLTEDGERIEGVQEIRWEIEAGGLATTWVRIIRMPVHALGEHVPDPPRPDVPF